MKNRPTPQESEWTIDSREIVNKNPWTQYIHDKGKTKTGKAFNYYYLDIGGSAAVVGLVNGKLLLVNQYRYPTAQWSLEVPGGGIEQGKTAEDTAKAELREETGYEAQSLLHLGDIQVMNGYANDIASIYFSPQCKKVGEPQLEDTEEGAEVQLIPTEQVFELVQEGKITDGFTLAALMLAFPHIL